ncbi:hypothetical protein ACHWQZ_G007596 [Mnemiopsis leidyi]
MSLPIIVIVLKLLFFSYSLTGATQYTVTTYTSDIDLAGTDDDVYFSIIGSRGKTSEYEADNSGNDRERGEDDTYTFTDSADIGKFQCVFIRKTGRDGWHINKIKVQIDSTENYNIPNYIGWLDNDGPWSPQASFCIPNSGCTITTSSILLECQNSVYKTQYLSHVSGMVVNKQFSASICTLGYTYGYDNTKIWVYEGCRAEFTIEQCLPGADCDGISTETRNCTELDCECTGLDPDWQNVTTDIEFPVNQGEVIVVNCIRNHINLGERSFTCVVGTSFNEAKYKPLCKKIVILLKLLLFSHSLTGATKYTVTTYTSDITDAGTNEGDVYLSIIGSGGKTSEHTADNWGNDREQGQVDTYTFTDSADIGKFRCVFIRKTGSDGWHIDKIKVQIDSTENYNIPNYIGWLDNDGTWSTQAAFCIPKSGCTITTSTVLLESQNMTYKTHSLSHVNSMVVKNKLSDSPCTLGYTYGYDNTKIWVYEGCGAEFTIEQCLPDCECTGLNPEWQNVTTDKKFPVNQGEVIVVKCKRNHINLGVRSFTCVMGTSFNGADDKPLCKKIGRSVSFFQLRATQYRVTTYTSKITDAGTNEGDVYLSIIGSRSNTSEHEADNWGNDAERGQEDTYRFTDSADIGKFQCVFIRKTGSDGWHIDKSIDLETLFQIEVQIDSSENYNIPNHIGWLDNDGTWPLKAAFCIPNSGCRITTSTVLLECQSGTYKTHSLSHVNSMVLKNKLSDSSCTLGYTYGYDNTKIWVYEGCGAEFTIEQCLPGKAYHMLISM